METMTKHPEPQRWISSTGILALSWTQYSTFALESASAADHAATERMLPRRSAEFTIGRLCARTAIRALGGGHEELGRLPNGAVDWPRGWTGSITHSQGVAIACVGRTTLIRGIGVDIEPNVPLPAESALALAQDRFVGTAAGLQDQGSRLGFSAREAAFKALSAIGRSVPILAMTVTVWMDTQRAGRFVVELPGDSDEQLEGRWWVLAGTFVMTAAIIPEQNIRR